MTFWVTQSRARWFGPRKLAREYYILVYIFSYTFFVSSNFRGDVITLECFEKIIKKDWMHPLTGEKLTEKDIIILQRVIGKFVAILQNSF